MEIEQLKISKEITDLDISMVKIEDQLLELTKKRHELQKQREQKVDQLTTMRMKPIING